MPVQYFPNDIGVTKVDENGVVSVIPDDPANTDWQAYLAWLAAGNAPAGGDAPGPIDPRTGNPMLSPSPPPPPPQPSAPAPSAPFRQPTFNGGKA